MVRVNGSSELLEGVVAITAGGEFTCALKLSGEVQCWGRGGNGRLGNDDDDNLNRAYPVNVIAGNNSSNFLNIGTYHQNYFCNELGPCALGNVELSLASGSASPGNEDSVEVDVSGMGEDITAAFYSDSTCQTTVANAEAVSAGESISLMGLTEGVHRLYYTVGNSSYCSPNYLAYVLDLTPPAVPGISITPSSGTDANPVLQISGTGPGDLIKVYRGTGCVEGTDEAGAADLRAGTVSSDFEITANELTATGTYQFYVKAVDIAGNESGCSATPAEYTLEEAF